MTSSRPLTRRTRPEAPRPLSIARVDRSICIRSGALHCFPHSLFAESGAFGFVVRGILRASWGVRLRPASFYNVQQHEPLWNSLPTSRAQSMSKTVSLSSLKHVNELGSRLLRGFLSYRLQLIFFLSFPTKYCPIDPNLIWDWAKCVLQPTIIF